MHRCYDSLLQVYEVLLLCTIAMTCCDLLQHYNLALWRN